MANIITDSVNDINISGKRGEKKMSIIEVKNLNKEFKIKEKEKGIKGSNMIDIYVSDESIGTPLFSYYCVKIIGDIVE